MGESHSYRMWLDPDFKKQLEATIKDEKGRGGKAGGLSLLFRRLGHLYLRKLLPAQRWRDDLAIPEPDPMGEDIAESSLDDIEAMLPYFESKVFSLLKDLTETEWDTVEMLQRNAEGLTEPKLEGPTHFDQFRGLVLVGRLRMLMRRKEDIEAHQAERVAGRSVGLEPPKHQQAPIQLRSRRK